MSLDNQARVSALVERIRLETGKRVPDVDPDGPGSGALVLLVLIAPSSPGALDTNVVAPSKNQDAIARNQQRLLAEAGLDEAICTWWNAVPWDTGDRPKPTAEDVRRGAPHLSELVGMMADLRAVVAMGRIPQRACRLAGIDAISSPNPSPLGLYGGGANRWDECRAALAEAARRAR